MHCRVCCLRSLLIVVCLLAIGPSHAARSDRTYHILVINSRQQGTPWTFAMMGSLEQTLLNAPLDIELQIDYMHTARFIPGKAYFETRSAVYAYEFRSYKFDCIVSVGEDALSYMLHFGNKVFPGVPVIFCGISTTSADKVRGLPHLAAVSSDWNLESNLRLITRLCPWARQVVFVHDQTSEGRAIAVDANRLVPLFPRLHLRFLTDLTMDELVRAIRQLPDDAVLVLLPFTIDKAGDYYPADVAVKMLATASPVPAFGLWSFEMAGGLTGGLVLDEDAYGRAVAEAAIRVARGASVKSAVLPHHGATRGVFDYRKLQQFGISVSSLPEGSAITNHPASLFVEYRSTLLWLAAGTGVVLAAVGLVALSANRRRRAIEQGLRLERETNEHKRHFYRETLLSVTDDKLVVCDDAEVEPYLNNAEIRAQVSGPEDVSKIRCIIQDYCTRQGMDEETASVLLMAVGEAATNAIKHAAGGQVFAGTADGQVWVAIADTGSGIDSLILPRVALKRGFSTKPSLGMGYTVMLDAADRVMLCTGDRGTTVVLFKYLQKPPEPSYIDIAGGLFEA